MPEGSAFRVKPGARIATPLCRFAQDLAAQSGWRRYGLAFLFGALLAGAMPPFDMSFLVFAAFPGLLWLDEGSAGPWASARLGYVFGLGFFVAGMYWIAAALFVDIARFWWALPFAVLGLPAVLSAFPAAALGLTGFATARLGLAPIARVFLFAVAWSAAEWARGHVLTGLPWNLVGYAWSGGFPGALTILQSTAWVGIYGLSFITVLAASLLALLGAASLGPLTWSRRAAPAIAAALLMLVPAAAGALRLRLRPPAATATWLRLVQPSIPETLKWNPAAAEANFARLIELSSAPAEHPLAAVLWPEAASPFFLERDAAHREMVAAVAPKGGYVLTGALRATPPGAHPLRVWNSVEAIDSTGAIRARYDKAHLVPFGEYMPFADLLPMKKITPGAIDLSAGPGPETIALPGLPPLSPIVCYEAIFPGAVVDRANRPAWILNVTNDAWYGRSTGPYQHFAIARTRAVEEGLPLVRVANNGISGVIDAEGRVAARTGLDDVTYADVQLPAAAPPTLYAMAGDWLFVAMLALGLVPAALRRGA
ncbi:MAG TPA: apolipoprotein N-acyltransferase [Stellaceae bacterium]|nr:apolipoprotein N-acyltransferase [Stellaceae bacterium]